MIGGRSTKKKAVGDNASSFCQNKARSRCIVDSLQRNEYTEIPINEFKETETVLDFQNFSFSGGTLLKTYLPISKIWLRQ